MIPYILPYTSAYYYWNYFIDGNWFPAVCLIVMSLAAYICWPMKDEVIE